MQSKKILVLIAFIIVPLIPMMYFSTVYTNASIFKPMPLIALVVYFITAVIAFPLYLLMINKGWIKWWHFAIAAVIPAISWELSWLVYGLTSSSSYTFSHAGNVLVESGQITYLGFIYTMQDLAVCAVLGIISGLAFWGLTYKARI